MKAAGSFAIFRSRDHLWPIAVAFGLYLFLTAIAIVGARTLPLLDTGIEPAGSQAQALAWPGVWARWDAGQYVAIAEGGYEVDEKLTAWYPLYPLLIRLVSSLTGINAVAAGTLLSLLFTAVSFVLLYQVVYEEYGTAVARLTIILLALFPTALFFYSIYSEALFLLLTVLAYGLARKRQWVWAAVVCLVAGLSRTNGFLVAVLVAVEYLSQHHFDRRSWFSSFLLLAAGVAGLVLFQIYLWLTFGDLLHTLTVQREWGRYITWPWITVWDTLKVALTGQGVGEYWFWHLVAWEELLFAAFFLIATIASWRLLRLSCAAYLTLTFILYASSYGPPYATALFGMPRYVVPLFPIFIVMAIVLQGRTWLWAVLLASTMLLAAFTLWFGSGHWVS